MPQFRLTASGRALKSSQPPVTAEVRFNPSFVRNRTLTTPERCLIDDLKRRN